MCMLAPDGEAVKVFDVVTFIIVVNSVVSLCLSIQCGTASYRVPESCAHVYTHTTCCCVLCLSLLVCCVVREPRNSLCKVSLLFHD